MYTPLSSTSNTETVRTEPSTRAQPSSSRPPPRLKSRFHQKLQAITPYSGIDITPHSREKNADKASLKPPLRKLTTPSGIKGLYWFDDTYKKANRLNFLGHVWVDGDGNGKMRVHIKDQYRVIDGMALKEIYAQKNKKPVDYFYKYIRVISSHSAEGTHPFGQQVAHAFGLETKAFLGFVNTLRTEVVEKLDFNRHFVSRTPPYHNLNTLLKTHRFTLIEKEHPKTPHKLAKWTGYNPVKFPPCHQEPLPPSQPDTHQPQ